MQKWFALSDPAMEQALYEIASLRGFARLSLCERIPYETTILNFRHLLEANDLPDDILEVVNAHLACEALLFNRGGIVDATIVAARGSTKSARGERDPEMHQTKKGDQWRFGMKAHIAGDAYNSLVHTKIATAANESDVQQISGLLQGSKQQVWADSGYRGAPQAKSMATAYAGTSLPGLATSASCPRAAKEAAVKERTRGKTNVRAKFEHPLRVIKRQFSLVKVRFRALAKNTAHVVTLFALSNLWMARRQFVAMMGVVRSNAA
jgi:IS5 family transposase